MRTSRLAGLVVATALVLTPTMAVAAPGNGNGAANGNSSNAGGNGNASNGNASNSNGSSGNASNGNASNGNGNAGSTGSDSAPAANPGQGSGSANGNGNANGNASNDAAGSSSSGHAGANGNGNANGNAQGGSAASSNAGGNGNGNSGGNGNAGGNGNGAAATAGANGNAGGNGAAGQGQNADKGANTSSNAGGNGSKGQGSGASAKGQAASQSRGQSAARMQAVGASQAMRALKRAAALDDDATDAEEARAAAELQCLQGELVKLDKARGTKRGRTPIEPTAAQLAKAEADCEEIVGDRGDYIVLFRPGTPAADAAEKAKTESGKREATRIKVKRTYRNVFPGMLVEATDRQMQALKRNPNVQLIEPDGLAMSIAVQSPAPWGLDRIDQPTLPMDGQYSYGSDGAGTSVYVIDTGIRTDHQDFAGRVASGYSSIADGRGINDCNGHGTHVAGTVAGSAYGVAKAASIVPVRVLDCFGSGTWSGVISGLDWVAGQHQAGQPAVANMSLGGGASSSVDAAVQALINDGVTVVVAAGNSAADACTASPARVPSAITVAASDSSDSQASFSNVGSCVDLYAPGVGITSAWHTASNATNTISGTSMASPHAAGVAAQLLASKPSASPAEIAADMVAAATTGAIANADASTANRLLRAVGAQAPAEPAPEPTPQEPSATVPAAPTAVSAVGGRRSATVTWSLPADGGSALTSQTVWVFDSRGRRVGSVSAAASATTVTISGLAPRKSFSFSVQAANVVGLGPESERSAPIRTS